MTEEKHTHRYRMGQPAEGVSHGVCACGAEVDCMNPDYRLDQAANKDRWGKALLAKANKTKVFDKAGGLG